MATPQELQNALMLKKTQGLTTEQAVNQSRVPVTATSQINQDRLAQNQASRQGTTTPVLPTAPVTAPVTPTTTPNGATLDANGTVTAPTTQQDLNNKLGGVIQPNGINSVQPINAVSEIPATPKVDPTPGITQDAFQQAKLESEKIKAQNDAVLSQNQQKSDLAKQEQERIATEANNQLANNEGAILNTLKTGGMIPEVVKSSPFYKSAQQTYNKLQQYSTYSTNELVTAMNQGSIVPGTNVYNEMMKDPAMKQKLTDAQVYRAGNPVNSTQIYENASSEILSNNPTTANYLADGVITQQEYDQATNNTEVVAKAKEVEEKANKYNTLKAEYDSIEDEVNAQFPGSPFADSIIADRQKAKYKNLVLAKGEWETSTGTLTELKSQASTLFEKNLELSESRRAEQNQIEAENRAVQRSKDALQYEADFNKAQAELALNDPATQIQATMKQFEDLGIVSQGDIGSKLQEFKDSGLTLPEYIKGLRKLYMEKPEYKRIQEIKSGAMSDVEKLKATQAFQNQSDIRNFAQQKELAKYNNDLQRQEFLWQIENDPEKKAKALALEAQANAGKSLFDMLGKNVGTYEGNRGYDLAGALGDPLQAGGNWTVKSIDTAGEQVGSIFIGGKGSKPYGNTVVMQDENGNEIRYSHLQNIGVKPGDVLGFGDIVGTRGNTGNVMGANGEKLTAEQLKAGRGAHLDVEIKNPQGKLLSNADQVNFLKGLKAGGGKTNGSALPLYRAYMEDNKLPSKDALAGLGMTSDQFANNADAGYDAFLKTKAKEISDTYPTLDIEYTGNYAGNSATQKEKLNESVTKIGDIDSRISQLKALFAKNGTEVWPTKDKSVMESLRKQIILKAKEVENLGVLNGPDLGILEDLLPSTTGFMSGMFSLDSNTMAKIENIQENYRNDAKTKAINYGARLNFGDGTQQASTTNQSNTAPTSNDPFGIR